MKKAQHKDDRDTRQPSVQDMFAALMQEIATSRKESTKQIAASRKELKEQIAASRKESKKENRKFLDMLMQEIADVRLELKKDIAHLDQKLTKRIDTLSSDFQTLRIEVHQNQTTFMHNHNVLDTRVTTLETAA